MPKVPIYEPQIAINPLPGAQIDNSAAGLAGQITARGFISASEQLANIGDIILRKAEQMQEEDDNTAVLSVSSEFTRELTEYLYNPETGVLNKKGQEAENIYQKSRPELEALAGKYLAKAKNKRQQALLSRVVASQIASADEAIVKHDASQRAARMDEALEGNLDAISKSFVLNAGNEEAFAANKVNLENAIRLRFGSQGEQVVQNKLSAALGKIETAILDQLIETAPDKAMVYFETHKTNLPAEVVPDYEKRVKAADEDIKIRSTVELMLGEKDQTGNYVYTFRNFGNAEKYIRSQFEGKLADKAVDYLKQRLVDQETAYNAAKARVYEDLVRLIGNKSYSNFAVAVDAIKGAQILAPGTSKLGPEAAGEPRENLPVDVQQKLIEFAGEIYGVNPNYPEYAYRSDPKAIAEIMDLAHIGASGKPILLEKYPTRNAFVAAFQGRLSVSDMLQYMATYEEFEHPTGAKAEGPGEKPIVKLSYIGLLNDRISAWLKDKKIKDPDKIAQAKAEIYFFVDQISREKERELGRPLQPQEFSDMVNFAFRETIVNKRSLLGIDWLLPDETAPAFEILFNGVYRATWNPKKNRLEWVDKDGQPMIMEW